MFKYSNKKEPKPVELGTLNDGDKFYLELISNPDNEISHTYLGYSPLRQSCMARRNIPNSPMVYMDPHLMVYNKEDFYPKNKGQNGPRDPHINFFMFD